MPEPGGPSTWSGLAFQNRVLVYQLARMISGELLQESVRLTSVRVEAPSHIDDLVVVSSDGVTRYQTIKEALSIDASVGSAWQRMWTAVLTQSRELEFDKGRDRIDIISSVETSALGNLKELISRCQNSLNAVELEGRLSSANLKLFAQMQSLLSCSKKEVYDLLRVVTIQFLGEPDILLNVIQSILSCVCLVESDSRILLVDALSALGSESGTKRKYLDFSSVSDWLRTRGFDLQKAAETGLVIIRNLPLEVQRLDVERFFRGFPASWALVAAGVPIERTCYVGDPNCKKRLIEQAAAKQKKPGLLPWVIVGPQGVGKHTLAKQIASDLVQRGHLVCWLHSPSGRVSERAVADIRALQRKGERVHLFASLSIPRFETDRVSAAQFLDAFANLIGADVSKSRLSVYLLINSNDYELCRDDLEELFVTSLYQISVPINLDSTEIDALIATMRRWEVLREAAGKTDHSIKAMLQARANRVLLVSLLELLGESGEANNFDHILVSEYKRLPPFAQELYLMCAICHSAGVDTPLDLLVDAAGQVTDAPKTFELLRASLKDIVTFKDGHLVATRHPVVASRLCETLKSRDDEKLWRMLIFSILRAIKATDGTHQRFVRSFASRRTLSILSEEIDHVADELLENRHPNLSEEQRSRLLSSIARIKQARGDVPSALRWAKAAGDLWPDPRNPSHIIAAYCHIVTRSAPLAVTIAKQLLASADNRVKLNALRVLLAAGASHDASEAMSSYGSDLRSLPGFGYVNAELIRKSVRHSDFEMGGNPWAHAEWVRSRLQLGQIGNLEAIPRLMQIVKKQPNIHSAFVDLCHLLFWQKRDEEVASICDEVYRGAHTKQEANERTKRPLNPLETQSMALATKAWAIFRQRKEGYASAASDLFAESLKLKFDNAWCHNWYALFLHLTQPASKKAEVELHAAIRCNDRIPPFYRNLARVLLETNSSPFLRHRNIEVMRLCERGLMICPPESYWNIGDLRGKILSIQYVAKSLQRQRVPDRTQLATNFELDEFLSPTGG